MRRKNLLLGRVNVLASRNRFLILSGCVESSSEALWMPGMTRDKKKIIYSFDLCKAMNEFESKSTLQMNLGFAI